MDIFRHIKLRDLQYVVAVANRLNFNQAAADCLVSQPTLSNQIKKLESSLGLKIFERSNKRVLVTPLGAEIVATAKQVLQQTQRIEQIALSAKDPFAGNFSLGAFPTLATYLLPDVAIAVRNQLPKLALKLIEEKTDQLVTKLKLGELDAALLAMPIDEPQLQHHEVFSDPFFLAVAASHPLAKRKTIAAEELTAMELMLLEEGHCLRDQALEVCQLSGAKENQDLRATNLETLRQLVKANAGVTLMPKIAIDSQSQEPGVVYVPIKSPQPKRTIALYWRKTSVKTVLMEWFATNLLR